MVKRVEIICYYENLNALLKFLEGQNLNVIYTSEKNEYVIFYMDEERTKSFLPHLEKQDFVKEVMISQNDMEHLNF